MRVLRTVRLLATFAVVLFLSSIGRALADDVADEGKFFTADTIRSVSDKIQELHRHHGYRVKVETIEALPASEHSSTCWCNDMPSY